MEWLKAYSELHSVLGFKLGLCVRGKVGKGEDRKMTIDGALCYGWLRWAPNRYLTLNYRTLTGRKCNPFLLFTWDKTGAKEGSENRPVVGPFAQGARATTGSSLRCCSGAKSMLTARSMSQGNAISAISGSLRGV